MKILFIVDGRSPTALNWIKYFVVQGHEVHLVSLFPCQLEFQPTSLTILPLRFSMMVGGYQKSSKTKRRIIQRIAPTRLRTWLRHQFVPGSIPKKAMFLRSIISKISPDLIHAMRIPFEGMLAAFSLASFDISPAPFFVSVWGNDFTLHAPSSQTLARLTRHTLKYADGLHTDCQRDQVLARLWGFDSNQKLSLVVPGAGGIQGNVFYPSDKALHSVVINPRGLRVYVRNDTFFKAIPLVVEKHPNALFLCPNMLGKAEAEKWVEVLDIKKSVKLLPFQKRENMASLYQQANIVVSPSIHDGTPNTLLEAMACGCFPIAGDIDSIREWIIPGVNGLVFNPLNPGDLATQICTSLDRPNLRLRAMEHNTTLIAEKAEYHASMKKALAFYQRLISSHKRKSKLR